MPRHPATSQQAFNKIIGDVRARTAHARYTPKTLRKSLAKFDKHLKNQYGFEASLHVEDPSTDPISREIHGASMKFYRLCLLFVRDFDHGECDGDGDRKVDNDIEGNNGGGNDGSDSGIEMCDESSQENSDSLENDNANSKEKTEFQSGESDEDEDDGYKSMTIEERKEQLENAVDHLEMLLKVYYEKADWEWTGVGTGEFNLNV
ncbi:hypothetical protein TWF730_008945 [Orbilia blumenaviensis]|uniref:Uncharacterized protein n=1 Tax=Orbilia blumenaviensis TaxID=1796055 RepID=A0AAV9UY63_9PEZI